MQEISKDAPLENYITLLNGRKLEDLAKIRLEIGALVHRILLKQALDAQQAGKKVPMLILINTSAAGKDANAIASNDGSSQYFAGGLTDYSQVREGGYDNFDAHEHVMATFQYWEKRGISAITIIAGGEGYASGDRAGHFMVYAGSREKVLSLKLQATADEMLNTQAHRAALQEISAIATLCQILNLNGMEASSLVSTIKEMEGIQISIKDPFLLKAQEVQLLNEQCWAKMLPLLQKIVHKNPKQKISVGESFTSGILASLMTSLEGSGQVFDVSLNWYNPKFKEYVGVSPENLAEDKIAEPETIALAVQGLLEKSTQTTGIVLGTTGWANYWVIGEADYFSIGLACHDDKRQEKLVKTAKVVVTISKNEPKSKGRRQLTRHLGAATALHLLAEHLAQAHVDEPLFLILSRELLKAITENGSIETRHG